MGRSPPTFFEQHSEPVDRRIATGLHKLGLALKQQTWALANEDGLSPTQGQILSALSSEGALSGTELADRLGVKLPTVSDSVRVLVEKGLVVKKPDPRHPRASLVELTSEGHRLAAQVRSWPEFLALAVGVLTEAEQETFLLGLLKMIRSLQEKGQIPVHRMCVSCKYFRPNVHSGPAPHHCALVDAPLAPKYLRLDCPEHQEAEKPQRDEAWERFIRPS